VKAIHRLGSLALQGRYAVLLAWSMAWFVVAHDTRPKGLTDWLTFEFGARTLVHLNPHYNTGALALYAHYPFIQIGPPPLAILGALQWLPPADAQLILAVAMMLAGVWCLRCAELVAGRHRDADGRHRLQLLILKAGLVVAPIWGWESGRWEHLDDIMAITAAMTAMAIISSGKRWWLAAVLVGLAVASKPWALVIAPCLLGLPREDRGRASLVTIITAAACWGPFVLGDPKTISALGNFQFTVDAGSTMHFLGMSLGNAPRWVRPVQFIGGFLLALGAVARRRWAAVPLIAFGFRVFIDPQMWMYYGLGPLVAATLWDCSTDRKWPVWTVATAVVEFGVPRVAPAWSGPVRLVWFLVIVVTVLRPNHDPDGDPLVPVGRAESVPVPVLA